MAACSFALAALHGSDERDARVYSRLRITPLVTTHMETFTVLQATWSGIICPSVALFVPGDDGSRKAARLKARWSVTTSVYA